MSSRLFTIGAALALAACSSMASLPAKAVDTAKGAALVDAKGMTLYTFDKDAPGESKCVDACATLWPVFAAPADATSSGDFAPIKRADGTKQWAYKGKPLYTWSKDTKPGDVSGDGVKDVWHIAHP